MLISDKKMEIIKKKERVVVSDSPYVSIMIQQQIKSSFSTLISFILIYLFMETTSHSEESTPQKLTPLNSPT